MLPLPPLLQLQLQLPLLVLAPVTLAPIWRLLLLRLLLLLLLLGVSWKAAAATAVGGVVVCRVGLAEILRRAVKRRVSPFPVVLVLRREEKT